MLLFLPGCLLVVVFVGTAVGIIPQMSCSVPLPRSCEDFLENFYPSKPAVFRNLRGHDSAAWRRFAETTSAPSLSGFDHLKVELSTANSYTGRVMRQSTVAEYAKASPSQSSSEELLGNETFYLFGNHHGTAWDSFLSHYPSIMSRLPCLPRLDSVTLSFGAAARGTGVPWHFHGPGFLDVLLGGKTWFLHSPDTDPPPFDPNQTTLFWVEHVYREHQTHQGSISEILECTLFEGDVIYFPPSWRHATLNLMDWNTWVTSFC